MTEKPKLPPLPEITPESLEVRLEKEHASLLIARDQIRMQFNGIENQLFAIERLLNPEPPEKPSEEPSTEPAENITGIGAGIPTKEGTI